MAIIVPYRNQSPVIFINNHVTFSTPLSLSSLSFEIMNFITGFVVIVMINAEGIVHCNYINFSTSCQPFFGGRNNSILGALKDFVVHIANSWVLYILTFVLKYIFRIYIVNQTDEFPFNRGMLLNAGFK